MMNSISKKCRILSILFLIFLFQSCKSDDKVAPIVKEEVKTVPFENVPSVKDMVVYEVNLKAFSKTGDINGVTAKLDYLKSLGVNVLWLMPIYPIGEEKGVGSPYAVKDYTAVNPSFGTLQNMKDLVSEAHDKDMAVILDWVANHTAWDNAWVSKNPSWYVHDDAGNIIIPPNTEWTDVAELNYDSQDMRGAMIDAMKFWVTDVNVDGFRCDAVDFVPADFWKQAISTLNSIPERNLIWLAESASQSNFGAGFELNYGWEFNTALRNVFGNAASASNVFTTNTNEYNAVSDGGQKLRFTTNHDLNAWDGSVTDFYNTKEGSEAAFVISTYMNGVPLIYTGQEIAHPSTISFFDFNPLNWTINEGILNDYKEIIAIYKDGEALKNGTLTSFADKDVVAFQKSNTQEKFTVIVNVRNTEIDFGLPAELQQTSWTNLMTQESTNLTTSITLSPYQYLILKE